MINDYFSRIQNLTSSQIQEVNLWVDNSIGGPEIEEQVFVSLSSLLADKESDEFFAYRNSYTRWFATYAWHLYQSLRFEQTVPLLSQHVFIGFLLGENVWNTVVTYLNNRSIDQKDMEEKYAKLREAFLHSQEIIYADQVTGKNYTVEQFVVDSNLPQVAEDTLLQSEFFSKFEGKVEQRIVEGDYPVDAFQVTGRLRDLANFFVGIKPDRIWYAVDPYFHPQEYTEETFQLRQNNTALAQEENFEGIDTTVPDLDTYTKNVVQDEKNRVSYQEIAKQLADSTAFVPDDEKDEQIIVRLGEFAEQYNDDRIRDLYYFDEYKGEFVWNEELLNEE